MRTLIPLLIMLAPAALQACPVCFGAAGSQNSQAMGIAIVFLLGVLGVVLGSIVAFIFVLARRSQGAPPDV